MLPSSLPLPHLWNFLLPLSAPAKIIRFRIRFHFQSFSSKCFRFHKNLTASTSLLSMKQLIVFSLKKAGKFTLQTILFDLFCRQGMTWNGMKWKTIFPYSILAIFVHSISIHTKTLPFHNSFQTKIFFHIPYHTSIQKKV